MGMAAMPASAQLYWDSPNFSGAPVQGDEAEVLTPLPGSTEQERTAEMVWTLRAALNIAALQCQFSPSLMTVPNYNQLLKHHEKELGADYKALQGYFKRTAAKGASVATVSATFDRFNTRTYSSFSSVFGQIGFCQTASKIGTLVLLTPKGSLHETARLRLREMRNSLKPAQDRIYVMPRVIQVFAEPVQTYGPDCFDKKGRLKKQCARA